MDPQLFRRTMGRFATGVTVITVADGESVHGMTANAFMSVSLDPSLIVVSVDRRARMHERLRLATHFAVSILAADQKPLSLHFAGRTDPTLAVTFVRRGPWAFLPGVLAEIGCTVHARYDGGDHTLFLGRVEHLAPYEGEPLVFYQGQYRTLADPVQV
ncbi:flavin reductase family protein [Hydrogenibacillus sp. N12]|uniref:flavin reductase family protein n=1 Tax=Hydrogenibacillus sp. N12 TaxID=2866627 RepID=UPI001C7DF842|nr:flavin reductase family protein [Hydrogenibacillus sp. N12]QZA31993.1 flavin reductase family protein [Hydrogenibacillus sp. N12]